MTITPQPRQPMDAPTGGQFAASSKSSAATSLSPSSESGPPAGSELEMFALDEVPGLLGYDSGEEWNGFATPWLTAQSLERVAEATVWWRDEDEAAPLIYRHPDTGVWMIDEGIDYEETEGADAPRVHPVAAGLGPDASAVYRLEGWMFHHVDEWDEGQVLEVVDEEFGHYLDAARLSSPDASGHRTGLENVAWSTEAEEQMRQDLTDFITANQHLITAARAAHPEYDSIGNVGDDFWLTRNGHGSGFWDRGLGAVGDDLTAAAKAHGSAEVYVGEDDQLHIQ